jgi:hypothetical protein
MQIFEKAALCLLQAQGAGGQALKRPVARPGRAAAEMNGLVVMSRIMRLPSLR